MDIPQIRRGKLDGCVFINFNNCLKIRQKKNFLKERVSVICDCKKKKSQLRDRVKYGTCICDSFSFFQFGNILANALYQYLADAKELIIRDDFDIIERHAKAIRGYVNADPWDLVITDKKDNQKSSEYLKKRESLEGSNVLAYRKLESLWGQGLDN